MYEVIASRYFKNSASPPVEKPTARIFISLIGSATPPNFSFSSSVKDASAELDSPIESVSPINLDNGSCKLINPKWPATR